MYFSVNDLTAMEPVHPLASQPPTTEGAPEKPTTVSGYGPGPIRLKQVYQQPPQPSASTLPASFAPETATQDSFAHKVSPLSQYYDAQIGLKSFLEKTKASRPKKASQTAQLKLVPAKSKRNAAACSPATQDYQIVGKTFILDSKSSDNLRQISESAEYSLFSPQPSRPLASARHEAYNPSEAEFAEYACDKLGESSTEPHPYRNNSINFASGEHLYQPPTDYANVAPYMNSQYVEEYQPQNYVAKQSLHWRSKQAATTIPPATLAIAKTYCCSITEKSNRNTHVKPRVRAMPGLKEGDVHISYSKTLALRAKYYQRFNNVKVTRYYRLPVAVQSKVRVPCCK